MMKAQQIEVTAPQGSPAGAALAPRAVDGEIPTLRVGILLVSLGILVAFQSHDWADSKLLLGALLAAAGSALVARARAEAHARLRRASHPATSGARGALAPRDGSPWLGSTSESESAYRRLPPPYLS